MADLEDVSLAQIQSRHQDLSRWIIRTPSVELASPSLRRALDAARLYLKLEVFQHTGTFKARGALSVVQSLTSQERQHGVTAASAGNHAIAVAWAAREQGVRAKVVMQSTANPFRIRQARREGAEVVLMPPGAATFSEAERLVRDECLSFVHPFEGVNTTLGTAGVGLELMEDVSDLDAVVVAIGGGGLISGVAAVVKLMNPRCAVYGVEPKGADAVSQGLAAKGPVSIGQTNTIADSLAPPMSLPFSLSLIARYADEVVTVSDEEICAAVVIMQEQARLAVEPAAAAALGGALGPLRTRLVGRRAALVVCGSNIDTVSHGVLCERGQPLAEAVLKHDDLKNVRSPTP